jgi:predicted membrane-bound dolichyl-phosphate-mannose-protein mannosyltransferase
MRIESVGRGMNMESDDIAVERPVLATVVVAAVATVAYVGVQLALDGAVAPAETASFVLIFTLVYVAGSRYLRERTSEGDDGAAADDAAGETVE